MIQREHAGSITEEQRALNNREYPEIFRKAFNKYGTDVFAKNFIRFEFGCSMNYTRVDIIGDLIKDELYSKFSSSQKEYFNDQKKLIELAYDGSYLDLMRLIARQPDKKIKNTSSESEVNQGFFAGLIKLFSGKNAVQLRKEIESTAEMPLDSRAAVLRNELENIYTALLRKEFTEGRDELNYKKQGFRSFEKCLENAIQKWEKEDRAGFLSNIKLEISSILDAKEKFKSRHSDFFLKP